MIARILALFGNVTLWAGCAFAALCVALLVYSFAHDGARDLATWVITLGVSAVAVIIGCAIRYILGRLSEATREQAVARIKRRYGRLPDAVRSRYAASKQ